MVREKKTHLILIFATAIVCLLLAIVSSRAQARWSTVQTSPLVIKRHDITIAIEPDGSWKKTGSLEMKINTDQGRALMAAFKLPLGDELEDLKITGAESLEPTLTRVIALNLIVLRDIEGPPVQDGPLFQTKKAYTIPFGDLAVGTVTKIMYQSTSKRVRFPGVFSTQFDWGRVYPQLAGTLTFESKGPLYFDISRAARGVLGFTKGRLPNGNNLWKADLKAPVFAKPDGEQGGLLSTSIVPRLQVSNKNTWTPILDVLVPQYNELASDGLPAEFQKIVEMAKILPTTNERFNKVIEMVNGLLLRGEWSNSENGFTPQKLATLAQTKRGDSKDYAFATMMILRALGYTADVAFVWQQSPTEKLWIDEVLTTPSLELFNHAIVRVTENGKNRYFDPTNAIPFGDSFLSDVGGSWALTVTKSPQPFERLPADSPAGSQIKISKTMDLRPDASVVGSGSINVQGPLAAELKQVYLAQGPDRVEPYLRALFGLATNSESVKPMMRVKTQDRRGATFDFSFSYLAANRITTNGLHREFEVSVPGLIGIPMLATGDRATDVILSKNLTVEIETKVIGGDIADETNTSCLALTSFASLLRETRAGQGSFTMYDHLQFKTDRIQTAAMKTPKFQNEMLAYTSCLSRTRAAVGPRPAFEKSPIAMSPGEIATLKKPVAVITLQDIKTLDEISSPQLANLIATKKWLATRDMLRRNERTPPVMLEYASSILEIGHMNTEQGDIYLSDHVSEAAKIFAGADVQSQRTAKFNRVHATMLFAIGRAKEAIIALQNAMALEKGQISDATFAAKINARLGNEAKTEEWLKIATTLKGSKSTHLDAIENLAAYRMKQRKIPEFIALYRQAIAESPTNAWIYNDFAKQLQSIKMWDLSLEQSRKALSIMRFPEAEAVFAATLMGKAETIYFSAPGIATIDPVVINEAEKLALETLRYSRTELLAYRIAGHAAFLKAVNGDYNSLIATQSYFAKAIELGAHDDWLQDRHAMATQSLETRRPINQIYAVYVSTKNRQPAAKGPRIVIPKALPQGTNRAPAK
ncbi:hypothetical protein BH10BDE1_BH10BDE1_12010 [soil metagenome]